MYIDRTEAGKITGAYTMQQREGQEHIADDAAELLEYLNPSPTYSQLREREYPDYREFLDAKVKQASTDDSIRAAGMIQEAQYLADCLAVKSKHPKPE